MFDWKRFLDSHGIEYVTTGPNASKDHLNVKCPFCGSSDPTQHMGISLRGKGWSCWRSVSHRGRSRQKLIQALLGCSSEEAYRLSHDGGPPALPSDEDLALDMRSKLSVEDEIHIVRELELPAEFKPMSSDSVLAKQFRRYLEDDRGYRSRAVKWLCSNYNLQYAVRGRYAYRVITPIYDRYRNLLTWVGRTILDAEPRYLAPRDVTVRCNVKQTLLGLPLLCSCPNPRALLVCEGPFDAMWISVHGKSLGVYGTCLFGLSLSDSQAVLLEELRTRFDYVGMLLDSAADTQAFRLANDGMSLPVVRLRAGVKDPATLPPQEVVDLCLSVTSSQ